MWKGLLDKGKCAVGLHHGEWRYLGNDDCTTARVCVRCGVESRKVEHVWAAWDYPSEHSCEQQHVCPRCRATESQTVHSWQPPVWRHDDRCEQTQICGRCQEEKPAPVKHLRDRWEYLSPDDCTRTQVCSRCGSAGAERRVEHPWGEWQHSEFYGGAVRVCRRCGELVAPAPVAQTPPPLPQNFQEAPRQTSPPVERDARLAGHWRFTDAMSSGGFSQATDYHRVLEADGSFVERSHTCGSMGERWSEPEYGRWRTSGNVLYLAYDDGAESSFEYHLEGTRQLFFPGARSRRLWERVG